MGGFFSRIGKSNQNKSSCWLLVGQEDEKIIAKYSVKGVQYVREIPLEKRVTSEEEKNLLVDNVLGGLCWFHVWEKG